MKRIFKLVGIIALTAIIGLTMACDNDTTKKTGPVSVFMETYQRANTGTIDVYTLEVFKKGTEARNTAATVEVGDRYKLSILSKGHSKVSEGSVLRFSQSSGVTEFDLQSDPVRDKDGRVLIPSRSFAMDVRPSGFDLPMELPLTGTTAGYASFEPPPRHSDHESGSSGVITRPQPQQPSQQHTHSFGAWVTIREAQEGLQGIERRTCSCGETETRTTAALTPGHTHTFSDWVVTTEPQVGVQGSRTRTCSCGATETQTLAARIPYECSWGSWETIIAAQAGVQGLRMRTCSSCGATEEETIAALPPAVYEHSLGQLFTGRVDNYWYTGVRFCSSCSYIELNDEEPAPFWFPEAHVFNSASGGFYAWAQTRNPRGSGEDGEDSEIVHLDIAPGHKLVIDVNTFPLFEDRKITFTSNYNFFLDQGLELKHGITIKRDNVIMNDIKVKINALSNLVTNDPSPGYGIVLLAPNISLYSVNVEVSEPGASAVLASAGVSNHIRIINSVLKSTANTPRVIDDKEYHGRGLVAIPAVKTLSGVKMHGLAAGMLIEGPNDYPVFPPFHYVGNTFTSGTNNYGVELFYGGEVYNNASHPTEYNFGKLKSTTKDLLEGGTPTHSLLKIVEALNFVPSYEYETRNTFETTWAATIQRQTGNTTPFEGLERYKFDDDGNVTVEYHTTGVAGGNWIPTVANLSGKWVSNEGFTDRKVDQRYCHLWVQGGAHNCGSNVPICYVYDHSKIKVTVDVFSNGNIDILLASDRPNNWNRPVHSDPDNNDHIWSHWFTAQIIGRSTDGTLTLGTVTVKPNQSDKAEEFLGVVFNVPGSFELKVNDDGEITAKLELVCFNGAGQGFGSGKCECKGALLIDNSTFTKLSN